MALSRFGMLDPFAASYMGRDPFEDFVTSSMSPFVGGQGGGALMQRQAQPIVPHMTMDVKETEAGYEISCDAPGLDKDDIDVAFEDGVLRISAERKEEKKEETDRYHLQERRWGSVSRAVRLPKQADAANIVARYDQGVLKVVVGKQTEAAARKAIRVE